MAQEAEETPRSPHLRVRGFVRGGLKLGVTERENGGGDGEYEGSGQMCLRVVAGAEVTQQISRVLTFGCSD